MFALFGEHLDAMVAAVDHVEVCVLIAGQTGRSIELSWRRPSSAPRRHEVAVGVEHHNTVQPIIGNVGIPVLVQRHRVQPHTLPRAGAAAAEFPKDSFFARSPNIYLRDPRALVAFATPADHIRYALGRQSNRAGVGKTVAGGRVTADGMTPIVDTPFYYCCKHLRLPHAGATVA